MPFTFVAAVSGLSNSSSATLAASSALHLEPGDLIVAWVFWSHTSRTINSITTVGGNALTVSDHGIEINNDDFAAFAFRLIGVDEAAATFTLTLSGVTGHRRIVVLQFRPDAGDTVTFDVENIGQGTSASYLSGNISTNGDDEVVVGGAGRSDGTAISAQQIGDTNATGSYPANGETAAWYRILTATAANIHAQATGANDQWICNIIAFKATAAAGGLSIPVITEILSFAEVMNYKLGMVLLANTETANFQEAMNYKPGTVLVSGVETANFQEATSSVLGQLLFSISETFNLQEANAAKIGAIILAIAEILNLAETDPTVLIGLASAIYLPIITEALNVQEVLSTKLSGLLLSLSENVNLAEILNSVLGTVKLNALENMTLAEAITFTLSGLGISSSENIILSEVLDPMMGTVKITASELLALAEMLSCAVPLSISVAESLFFSENVIDFQDAGALIKFLMKKFETFKLKQFESFKLKKYS